MKKALLIIILVSFLLVSCTQMPHSVELLEDFTLHLYQSSTSSGADRFYNTFINFNNNELISITRSSYVNDVLGSTKYCKEQLNLQTQQWQTINLIGYDEKPEKCNELTTYMTKQDIINAINSNVIKSKEDCVKFKTCYEINTTKKCGIENCHGLEITCGQNIPDACTEVYMIGDFCRQYAVCEIINDKCKLIENSKFDECKVCVENCIEDFQGSEAFDCENECREKNITEPEEECAQEEELFSGVFDEYPNHCCEGLTEWSAGMDTRISIGDECYATGMLAGSPTGVCINCGNGICETKEDVCNCAEDCQNSQNSDYSSIEDFCESPKWEQISDECETYLDLEICNLC
jgi:hypothetical protein